MVEKKLERNWSWNASSKKQEELTWEASKNNVRGMRPNPDGDVGKQFRKKERYIIGDENDSLKELRGLMLSRLIDFALSNNDTPRN